MTSLILAIDLGKYKSVCCYYDGETKATTYQSIATKPDGLREAIEHRAGVTVVIEACYPAG